MLETSSKTCLKIEQRWLSERGLRDEPVLPLADLGRRIARRLRALGKGARESTESFKERGDSKRIPPKLVESNAFGIIIVPFLLWSGF